MALLPLLPSTRTIGLLMPAEKPREGRVTKRHGKKRKEKSGNLRWDEGWKENYRARGEEGNQKREKRKRKMKRLEVDAKQVKQNV